MNTYGRVRVVGAPRSGTHYVWSLLKLHLSKVQGLTIEYGNHPFGSVWEMERDELTIYVHRDLDATIASILRMHRRFGLPESLDPELDLLAASWAEDPEARCQVVRLEILAGADEPTRMESEVAGEDWLFRWSGLTLRGWLLKHEKSWMRFLTPDSRRRLGDPPFYVLRYEEIVGRPESWIPKIATMLRAQVAPEACRDIDLRVGWVPL